MRPKVLSTVPIPESLVERMSPVVDLEVIIPAEGSQEQEFKRGIADADAVILGLEKIDEEVLESASRLRVIARFGVGLDNVDVKSARRRGVTVTFTPVLGNAVADLTMGLILSLTRRIPEADRSVRRGEWRRTAFIGRDLQGKILGIVGLGRIGLKVAERAGVFGLHLAYFDVTRKRDFEERVGIRYRELEELLGTSDIISVHVPLTPETRGLIGPREIAMMKNTTFLINTSRGQVVDEKALYKALLEKRIAGAGLDTLAREEAGTMNPLFNLENVVITPHIGSNTVETRYLMAEAAVEDVIAVLMGGHPRYPVTPPHVEGEG